MAALVTALAAFTACSGGDDDDSASKAPPGRAPVAASVFAYDKSAPLRERSRVVAAEEDVTVQDVSFLSPGSGRVRGHLIDPGLDESRPAVIFLYGADAHPTEILPLAALWVGQTRSPALVIEAARLRPVTDRAGALRARRDATVQTVVRVRRAIDYLHALGGRRDAPIGFVGWSEGVRAGAILTAVEPRISAFALASGGVAPLESYVRAVPPELRDDVRRELGGVDPLRWIRRARPNTIFFQFAREDELVPRAALVALVRAASKPQRVRWYDGGHELEPRAYDEQREWLADKLGVG